MSPPLNNSSCSISNKRDGNSDIKTSSSNPSLGTGNNTKIISCDYRVRIRKDEDTHGETTKTKTINPSTTIEGRVGHEINENRNGDFEGSNYVMVDNEDMLMNCLDVMALKPKITLSISHILSQQWDKNVVSTERLIKNTSDFPSSASHHDITNLCDHNKPTISLQELMKTSSTATVVTIDILSTLLPSAIKTRLLTNKSPPPLGSILVGSKASGKSTLCKSIPIFLRSNSRTVVHSEHYNCEQLRGNGVDVINDKLSSLFERARRSAPSFLCLDNLDAICGSKREDGEVSYVIPHFDE
jgi:hypothetical protein